MCAGRWRWTSSKGRPKKQMTMTEAERIMKINSHIQKENELLKARCEAAERDMKKAQACACIICKHNVPSSGRKYHCAIFKDRSDGWGDGEVLMCGRFEWRGPREGETE